MIQNEKYSARYFNGKTAIPDLGFVKLENVSLVFSNEKISNRYSIESFCEFSFLVNGCKLIFLPDVSAESPILEIVCTKAEAKLLEKIWTHHRKGKDNFASLSLYFRHLRPITMLVLGSIFVTLFGFFYFFALQNIYILFPTTFDQTIAKHFDEQIEKQLTICNSNELDQFFELALTEIVPKNSVFAYRVKLIKSKDLNAFALAGGKIYFFSGLLESAQSQDEVLGVLAHEISHIERRHHVRSLIKVMGTSLLVSLLVGPGLSDFQFVETLTEIGSTVAVLKFSRDFESEADLFSLDLLKKSKFSLNGLLLFLKRLEIEERKISIPREVKKNDGKNEPDAQLSLDNLIKILSSHPASEDRIKILKEFIRNEKIQNSKQIISPTEWGKIKTSCATTNSG